MILNRQAGESYLQRCIDGRKRETARTIATVILSLLALIGCSVLASLAYFFSRQQQ